MNPIDYVIQGKIIKFYKSRAWRTLRVQALDRDNYECKRCKSKGIYSRADCVHHIKEIRMFPMLALTLDNLVCLCNQCHNEVHDKFDIATKQKEKPKFENEERW